MRDFDGGGAVEKEIMEIIEKKLSEITPYEKNPRKNDDAVEYVANSIREFGWKVPIVIDKDGVIIAGHTRYKAAQKLGYETVPCIMADDLTPEQVKAYRLADNKVSEFAEWDFDLLAAELDEIDLDMSEFGFDFEGEEGPAEIGEDEVPQHPEQPKSKRGQIYKLGRHRLMCGDATSVEDVRKLCGGRKVDVSITSPPYGASKSAKIRVHYVPHSETPNSFYNMHDDSIIEWGQLIRDAFNAMKDVTVAQFINIQMLADNKRELALFVAENAENLIDIIVWDKAKAPPQMQKNILNNQFEFVFLFGGRSRTIPFADFHGSHNNIIRVPVGTNEFADIHKAVFPVEFPTALLEICSQAETVLDVFGGTGTTLIACEQMNKTCYMMELDPCYVDVIIDRWEKFTGGKAVLIEA